MFQEKGHKGIGRVVVVDILSKIAKGTRVNQIFGLARKQFQEPSQLRFARRCLQILDNVELDVPVAQDLQRAVGFPSSVVMVNRQLLH